MKSVIDVLEELENAQGSNAKKEILAHNRENELLKRVLIAGLDPYAVYFVNKFKVPDALKTLAASDDVVMTALLDVVLPALASRSVTGNGAKELLWMSFQLLDERQQKWYTRVILRNLRIGVQGSTVNKVWPDLIKGFTVSLAETLKSEFVKGEGIKILGRVSYPVRVEPKLDGLRCIAVKKAGVVTLYTRSGSVLETLPTIKRALEEAEYDDLVLDGEAMGEDWSESASVLMSKKVKKDDSRITYHVFDAILLDEWVEQECSTQLCDRSNVVSWVVEPLANKGLPIKQVPYQLVHEEKKLLEVFQRSMEDGHEGVMLKDDHAPYTFKRSDNVLKLKPCVTYEGTVVGHYEGRKNTKREGQFGGFEVLLPNGAITRVGGGFNDAVRATIQLEGPDSWIGKVVECEAQPDPMTKDGLTEDGRMRFPVFVRERDTMDVDLTIITSYEKFRNEHGT